ncbi:MAG: AsmA-like C-terminal region-containing protein [Bacteroidales bacterium]|jgi:hypothetical protein|nr:AsmA-like C-terminal region-containing protein [Bacteroidales bacterium]
MNNGVAGDEKKKAKKKWIKRLIVSLTVILLIFLLAGSLTAFLFEDKIANIVLEKIYEMSKTEITHKSVSFSLIRKFPMASLQVDNITAEGSVGEEKLLTAEHIYLKFNILDLLSKNYTIRKIDIENARLQLIVNEKGKCNWDIFTTDDTSDYEVKIKLSDIKLSNVAVVYSDAEASVNVAVNVKSFTAKGDFSENVFEADLNAKMLIDSVNVKKINYLQSLPCHLKTQLYVDAQNENYRLSNAYFDLDCMDFTASATLSHEKNTYPLIADINIKNADIEKVFKKIQENINFGENILIPKGKLKSKVQLVGNLGGKKPNVSICGTLDGKEIKIENIKNDISLSKGILKGKFSMQTSDFQQSIIINAEEFFVHLNSGYLKGKASLKNLQQPHFELDLNAKIELEDWHNFIPQNYFWQTEGTIAANIRFSNTFSSMDTLTRYDFRHSTIEGVMVVDDVFLQMKENEEAFEKLNGELEFNNQTINAKKIHGKFKGNAFTLNGKIENVFPYLFFEKEHLYINADLSVPVVNINQLLKSGEKSSQREKEPQMLPTFPADVDFDMNFKAQQLVYEQFEASDLSGKIAMKNAQLSLSNLQMQTCQGKIMASGSISQTENALFSLTGNMQMETVNISKMFYAMGNFGQNTLTHKNINGLLNGTVKISFYLKNDMSIVLPSVKSSIGIKITDGQLINFTALQSLSRFVRISELQNIRFATLENVITIENSTLFIPAMDIKNNALNLVLSGEQTFAGKINYNIMVMLKEVLSKKFRESRKNGEDFGEVIDDKSGNTMVSIVATGTLDDPVFKWKLKSTQKDIKTQLQSQQEQIRQTLQEQNPQIIEARKKDKELNNSQKPQKDIEIDENW